MSHFKRRIDGNCWIVGDQLPDGTWKIEIIDTRSMPVADPDDRLRALIDAYKAESSLRNALWSLLPPDVQAAIREGRA